MNIFTKINEYIIMHDPKRATIYAKNIIKGRWFKAEKYIMKSPEWATYYAMFVIQGPWLEAEQYIKKENYLWQTYKMACKINK